MRIRRPRARLAGLLAVTAVIGFQAVPGFACHGQDLRRFAIGLGVFVLPPLLPALVSLATANPLLRYGFPSAVLGALLAGPVCRRLGIAIDP